MEADQEEPTQASSTLLGKASDATSSMKRARFRKKHFDHLFAEKATDFVTSTEDTYTFEFLQHLLDFEDFSVELGSLVGSIPLKGVLDGQPLQIMASHQQPRDSNKLWSFDIWHEMLVEDAVQYDTAQCQSTWMTQRWSQQFAENSND